MKKIDILIAGVGGQGTILAGNIISKIAIAENLDAKTAETHGMAQRGGSVINHVRLGEKVHSPLIPEGSVDFLLSFEALEGLRYLTYLAPDGTAIVNDLNLSPLPVLTGEATYPEDIIKEIKEKAFKSVVVKALALEPVKSNPKVLNIFLIGILSTMLPFSESVWDKAIRETIPPKILDINLKAFQSGRLQGDEN